MASAIVVPVETVMTDKPVKDAFTQAKTEIDKIPGVDTGTVTAVAGAATLNTLSGKVTSEALTTAAAADYVLTVTNSKVTAASLVVASADNGTNTTEGLAINRVTPGAGSLVIRVRNTHATVALNGTIKISFAVVG
jgi:hypothetical protein